MKSKTRKNYKPLKFINNDLITSKQIFRKKDHSSILINIIKPLDSFYLNLNQ